MQKNHTNLGGATTAERTLATVDVEPEFVDSHGLQAIFGIRRTLAYHLLSTGHIRSVSLRRPGTTRGKRLYVVKSVRDFLNAQLRETEGAVDTAEREAMGRVPKGSPARKVNTRKAA
jgi:hypothetical protein